MAYDIYGNKLYPGNCEVHPYIGEEYPCYVCRQRDEDYRQEQERNQEQADEYYRQMEEDNYKELDEEFAAICKAYENAQHLVSFIAYQKQQRLIKLQNPATQ